MSGPVVDRVAEALMRSRYRMGKPAHLRPSGQSSGGILLPISVQQANWDECLRDAKVAISAMREPTGEMVDAGNSKMPVQCRYWQEDDNLRWEVLYPAHEQFVSSKGVIVAAIDAALSEPPHG